MTFSTSRSNFREFGKYDNGDDIAERYPNVAKALKENDINTLLDEEHELYTEIQIAIRELPEFKAYTQGISQGLRFGAFKDSGVDHDGKKYTTENDVVTFCLERIKHRYDDPRLDHEYVMEDKGKIVGYVELFDMKEVSVEGQNLLQAERGIFILPEMQGMAYGKEGIIAVTDHAFKDIGLDRIYTMTDPDNNQRSMQNMMKNTGAEKIGEIKAPDGYDGDRRFEFSVTPDGLNKAVVAQKNQAFTILPKRDSGDQGTMPLKRAIGP